jgi:hypothetical protein
MTSAAVARGMLKSAAMDDTSGSMDRLAIELVNPQSEMT